MAHGAIILFFLGCLAAGVVGTETRLLFFWPACLLIGLAGLALSLRRKSRVASPPNDLCLAAALALAAYACLRAAFSPVLDYAREDFFVIAAAFIAYLIMATVAAAPVWRRGLLVLLLALAAGNMAVGWIHLRGDWDFHVVPSFARSFEEGRIGGFYNNPNHLAALLSMVVFVSLGQLCFGKGTAGWRLLLGFVIVTSMLGMALTVSRGALLGLATGASAFASAGMWLVWKCHPHLAPRLLSACLALAVVLGGVLWKVNEDYLRRRISEHGSMTDVRGSIWKSALAQHAEQPVLGGGARMFYAGGVRHRQPELSPWLGEPEFAHNEYLQALADYGWAGLLLLLFAVAVHLAGGWRFVNWFAREQFPRAGTLLSTRLAQATGAFAALSASAAQALVEFHWHVGGLAVLTAALAGCLANPGCGAPENRTKVLRGVRPLAKFAALLAAVCLISGAAVWGRADWLHAKGMIQAERGDGMSALETLGKAAVLDSQSAAKALDRARVQLAMQPEGEPPATRRERVLGALADLELAARLNPFDYLVATNLADVNFALGRQASALAQIRRALALAPLHEEPRLALALFHHRRREFQQAEEAYLWAAEARAANPRGTLSWIDGYRQLLMDAGSLPRPLAGVP